MFLLPIQKLDPSYQNRHALNNDYLSPNYQPLCIFYSHLHPHKSMNDNKSLNKELGSKHMLLLPLQRVPKQHNIGQPEGQPASSRMKRFWRKFNMTLMNVFGSCFSWDYLKHGVSVHPWEESNLHSTYLQLEYIFLNPLSTVTLGCQLPFRLRYTFK